MDPSPGILPPTPELRPLGAISPSRFVGLRECALREVWAASRVPAVLPTAPAARLGTVAHRLLEDAGRGRFDNASSSDIDTRWEELLRASEQSAAQSWLDRHLLPLSEAIPDFEVRKLRALAGAEALTAASAGRPRSVQPQRRPFVGYELVVATLDGYAGGRIDAVIASEEGPIIRDYKSGAIYEVNDTGERAVKEEYSVQLKLYAAIYASMTGTWPSRLELVPVGAEPEAVEFTVEECSALLTTAVRLRNRVNRIVMSGAAPTSQMVELSAPAPTTCLYCSYRPYCAPYQGARTSAGTSGWPSDERGNMVEVRTLGNGRRMVSLDSGGRTVLIRGLDPNPDRHPALELSTPGDSIATFNLHGAGSPTSFSEGPFTVVYKVSSDPAIVDPDPDRALGSSGT